MNAEQKLVTQHKKKLKETKLDAIETKNKIARVEKRKFNFNLFISFLISNNAE